MSCGHREIFCFYKRLKYIWKLLRPRPSYIKGHFTTKHCSCPFIETTYCALAAVGKTKYPPCLPETAQTIRPSPRRAVSIKEIRFKRKTLSWRKKSGTQKKHFQLKVVTWEEWTGAGNTRGNMLWLHSLLNWGGHKEEGRWRTGMYFRKEIWIPLE